jgi:GT2 family glycosyltransferase
LGNTLSAPRIGVACATSGRRACCERLFESVRRLDPAPALSLCAVQGDASGTAAMLASRFPEVQAVELPENLGVWGGMNAAYRAAFGREDPPDILAMIDDDAFFLEPGALAAIAEAFGRWPEAGVVQARIVEDGRHDEGDSPFVRAEWTGGANAMRRDAWEKVGPYPEFFFRSAGESVLAHRLLEAGLFCACEPRWSLAHRPEREGRNPVHYHDYSIRNRYLAAAMVQAPWEWPLYWAGHFGRSLARRAAGKPGNPLSALGGALALLPKALAERRPISPRTRKRYRSLKRSPEPLEY